MNPGWVVDTSVGLGWVHPAQATSQTTALLHGSNAGETLLVPALWFTEMGNALLVLQRRKKITQDERETALEILCALNLGVDDEPGRATLRAASKLAESYGLTVYDATYLELAIRKQFALATRDVRLINVAARCGVSVL